MSVTVNQADLEFILAQIKIAEAHAAGQPLFGPGGLVPAYNVSWGLRTVDGTYNNLLHETWGAADQQFPTLMDPVSAGRRHAIRSGRPGSGARDADALTTTPSQQSQLAGRRLEPAHHLQPARRPDAGQSGRDPDGAGSRRLGGRRWPISLPSRPSTRPSSPLPTPSTRPASWRRTPAPPRTHSVTAIPTRRRRAEEQAALDAAADADAAHALTVTALEEARAVRDAAVEPFGIVMEGDNVSLPNISPDGGLSASFNSWFTLFGQFFDHGLDLVNKGGSGTVFVPLQPDDPLYVPGSPTNFMVLTRATVSAGQDGVMGTADDVRPVNTTTSFVDQNQTYTSHSSHQVFLRQYELDDAGRPVATGKLIEGAQRRHGDLGRGQGAGAAAGHPADRLRRGQRAPAEDGPVRQLHSRPRQRLRAGHHRHRRRRHSRTRPTTSSFPARRAAPVNPTTALALRTGHAFLADIAHEAVPVGKIADGDITIGLGNPGNGDAEYDNELLDAHFIAGDGRVNENIGLTAVHHVFHAEHNRMVDHNKEVILSTAAGGDLAFLNEWLLEDVTLPCRRICGTLVWDGERLFQSAKFTTEMQYQHLVFEEFARKIQPQINPFVVPDGFDVTINPSIVAEFAHVVYRFGHSMLTESIDRFDPNFNPQDIGLIEGFLNPVAFDSEHTITDDIAAGAIIRGMTRQVGNEIDEFVTSALRNNLLGLPLDLATINLARGRDTGVPSLNAARREFYDATNNAAELRPYDSWVDFAGNLKHEASIINFVAAYGTHELDHRPDHGRRASATRR